MSLLAAASPPPWQAHARYGALGLPLAFVALPLYVILPAHYAQTLGVPLGALGLVLLASRLLDAAVDPWLGRWADRRLDAAAGAWPALAMAALVLALGVWAVFFPQVDGTTARLVWCAGTLTATYLAFSACSITHQAWGSRLGGDAEGRARWVAWREGLGIAGVLLANAVAAAWGPAAMAATLSASLAVALWALSRAPRPPLPPSLVALTKRPGWWAEPWRHAEFRRLLLLYLVNGVSGALPATLVIFFIQDVLQRPALIGVLLGLYFLLGAVSVPLWVKLVGRIGPSRAWAVGMLGNVLAFGGVLLVGPGDVGLYVGICVASGLMLGADLTAPGTLLTGVLQRLEARGRQGLDQAGVFTGWWQLVTKLNLALAAGVSLPLLAWLGYVPGQRSPEALQALSWVYGAVPCAFKTLVLLLWWRLWARRGLE